MKLLQPLGLKLQVARVWRTIKELRQLNQFPLVCQSLGNQRALPVVWVFLITKIKIIFVTAETKIENKHRAIQVPPLAQVKSLSFRGKEKIDNRIAVFRLLFIGRGVVMEGAKKTDGTGGSHEKSEQLT